MPAQLVTVEGNIGTGKTTTARYVASYMPDTKFFAAPEPEANPHWEAFQSSPAEHALALQRWFLRERARVYIGAVRHIEQTRESAILDFSVWSDLIFARKHFEDGFLTPEEFEAYMEDSRRIFALHLPPPHLSIVLQVDPDTCLDRCRASPSRSNQSQLARAHLTRLDELIKQRWQLRDDVVDGLNRRRSRSSRELLGELRGVSIHGGSLPPAPSLSVLVRDWSDLSRVRTSAIADAVMCTNPSSLEAWLAPLRSQGALAAIEQLGLSSPPPAAESALRVAAAARRVQRQRSSSHALATPPPGGSRTTNAT